MKAHVPSFGFKEVEHVALKKSVSYPDHVRLNWYGIPSDLGKDPTSLPGELHLSPQDCHRLIEILRPHASRPPFEGTEFLDETESE